MHLKRVDKVIIENYRIPATRPVNNKTFEFSRSFVYRFQILSDGRWHNFERHIPKGYLTDKRTTPAAIWAFRPRDGLCEFPALGHDPDYETGGYKRLINPKLYIKIDGKRSTMSKKAADDLYELCYDAILERDGKRSSEPERDKIWLMLFGWIHFGKTKRAIKKLRKERE